MEQKLKNAASQLPETHLQFDTIAAESAEPKVPFVRKHWRPAVVLAACLILLVSIGFGTYAYAAEVKEYNAAVQFFNDHDLSTEGLTRSEIKAIYRDITTKSFTYSKTAEVIRNSISSGPVGGYEIWQDGPSPEDVEKLWNDKNYSGRFVTYERDDYQFQVEFIKDDYGVVIGEKFYMEKYEKDDVLWRAYVPFSWGDYCEVADGVIVFGHQSNYDAGVRETDSWIAKLDHNGTLLWIHQLENGFGQEYAEGVLVNADGSYTLFSRGDNQYLCVSRYTPEGERVLYKQTDLGKHSVGQMAIYGDGYLLQISTNEKNEFARFIQVDQEGNVLDGFSYKDEKNNYVIRDMTEWAGKVYISAYATPKLGEEEPTYGGRKEIARILDYVFNVVGWSISDEELTPVVRDNYAAVLLVCDPNNGGKIQVFYTIPGSLGADLIVSDDGRLIWETESITTTFFSPVTSSFTIGGVCCVYQYAFDAEGTLVGRGKTEKTTNFRR